MIKIEEIFGGRPLYAHTRTSLEDVLKQEWWEAVREKYTLAQLEAILGNRFNLKDI